METVGSQYGRRETQLRLEEVGFDTSQARVLVDVISKNEEQLATKDDVAVLKEDVAGLKIDVAGLKIEVAAINGRLDGLTIALEGLRHEVRDRIDSLRQEFFGRLEAVEGRLQGRIDALNGQLVLIKWFLGLLLAATIPIMLALVRIAFA